MVDFIKNCLDGIMLGSSYALLAIGFTLIFGVMRRLNLSYGPSIMLGAFVGTLIYLEFQAGSIAVAAATIVGAVLAGMYVERLCFWAIRQGAALASMVSSFAVWMQLEEIVTVIFPDRTYSFPPLTTSEPLFFGPFFLKVENLIMFACALALMVLLHLLLYRTRFGLAVRAVSENPDAARFMGINIGNVMFWAFAVASGVGGVAGYLIVGADAQITPLFGLWATGQADRFGGRGFSNHGGYILPLVEQRNTHITRDNRPCFTPVIAGTPENSETLPV